MSDSLRYKIVLWMVWVQIALVPIVIAMIYMTDGGLMWRWNLINNLLVAGYILGLLALPVSRGLEKPELLKWWLRIDFWFSLIPAIIALPLLFYMGRHFIDAEDGDFVLYHTTGLMAASPHYNLGKKEGLFIRELPQWIRVYDYGNKPIECFKVDTLKGCMYGLEHGASPAAWVLPIDSVRYHRYADNITALIDSLYEAQPLLSQESYGTFVFPDNFAEINYEGKRIGYADSISYDIDFSERDSLRVLIFKDQSPNLSFPKDAIGTHSPKEIRTFIENLKGGEDDSDR